MKLIATFLIYFAGVDVTEIFGGILQSEPALATAIAAIRTLMLVLEKCPARTLQVWSQDRRTAHFSTQCQ